MLEYARRRVKLFCIKAAPLPNVIVAIATIAKVEYQSMLIVDIATMNPRKAAAHAAILAPAAKRALTVVGAPSKASGIHMWNGTTAILTPKPTMNNTIANTPKGRTSGVMLPNVLAIAIKFVEPDIPNTSDIAYTMSADERAERTKNFIAASLELGSLFRNAVSA